MAPLADLQQIAGDNYLQFDSAESLWGNLSTFRRQDSPLFLDIPPPRSSGPRKKSAVHPE